MFAVWQLAIGYFFGDFPQLPLYLASAGKSHFSDGQFRMLFWVMLSRRVARRRVSWGEVSAILRSFERG